MIINWELLMKFLTLLSFLSISFTVMGQSTPSYIIKTVTANVDKITIRNIELVDQYRTLLAKGTNYALPTYFDISAQKKEDIANSKIEVSGIFDLDIVVCTVEKSDLSINITGPENQCFTNYFNTNDIMSVSELPMDITYNKKVYSDIGSTDGCFKKVISQRIACLIPIGKEAAKCSLILNQRTVGGREINEKISVGIDRNLLYSAKFYRSTEENVKPVCSESKLNTKGND